MATKIPQLLTAALLMAVGSTPLHSQAVAAAPTAAQVTKYDANKNGRLDPAETVAMQADEAKARAAVGPASAGTAASSDGTVQLSPFEVREANNGYYASNTMSGTRLNTKLEDLASSISVVTKAQMQDFAMLDINDIFAYEANTEGTGNYTSFEVDRNGMVTDQIQNNPQGANRIRGVGSANLSLNNFANSGRAPIDPTAIDSVEISRGPNSNIFGLGEGSGTVNLVASTANLSRANSQAELRFDDLGGWRTSVDLNRPLLRGKVAVRVSAVYQHDEYKQKPSGFETRRFNFMLRAQPFKDTSIRASFNSYHGVGTRATSVTPRDAITYWRSVGSPTWDPVASVATVGGVPRQITYDANNNPIGGFPVGLAGQNFTQPILFLDNGIKLWQISRLPLATALDGPNNQGGALRLLESIAEPVRTGRPLFSTLAGVSSRDVYDYSRINLAAPNSIKDQVETTTVEFEQFALNTERHKLAFQVAWQREDADRVNRNIIGQASAGNASYYLYVDPNTRLLDGRTNPYFGRPYIGAGEPVTQEQPMTRDSYRGQGVYIADFTSSKTWTRWLGRQQFLGYYEERKTKEFRYRFRDVMTTDNPIYAVAGRPKGNQSSSGIAPNPVFGVAPLATRGYYHYYTGDNQGGNIDYAPTGYELGNYGFSWFNPATNAWVTDQVTLGRAGITEGTAGTFSVLNLIKTRGGMIQSTLLDDRIVATFGKRSDENRNKAQRPSFLKANGYEFDYAMMDGWVGDWALRSGDTKTSGIVVKPFRGWSFIEKSRASGGASGFVSQLLGGMTAYYNKSDSFRPDSPAISILLNELPNPTSEGKDYGFSINLGNKFVLRANKYTTNQVNTRAGQSAIFAQHAARGLREFCRQRRRHQPPAPGPQLDHRRQPRLHARPSRERRGDDHGAHCGPVEYFQHQRHLRDLRCERERQRVRAELQSQQPLDPARQPHPAVLQGRQSLAQRPRLDPPAPAGMGRHRRSALGRQVARHDLRRRSAQRHRRARHDHHDRRRFPDRQRHQPTRPRAGDRRQGPFADPRVALQPQHQLPPRRHHGAKAPQTHDPRRRRALGKQRRHRLLRRPGQRRHPRRDPARSRPPDLRQRARLLRRFRDLHHAPLQRQSARPLPAQRAQHPGIESAPAGGGRLSQRRRPHLPHHQPADVHLHDDVRSVTIAARP